MLAGQLTAEPHLAAGDVDLLSGGDVQLAQLSLQVVAVRLKIAKRLEKGGSGQQSAPLDGAERLQLIAFGCDKIAG